MPDLVEKSEKLSELGAKTPFLTLGDLKIPDTGRKLRHVKDYQKVAK